MSIFERKFVRIITKKTATRIMDLNQYLDRMSIKTTIIRIQGNLEPDFKDINQTDLQVGQPAGGLIKWADILPYFTMLYTVK